MPPALTDPRPYGAAVPVIFDYRTRGPRSLLSGLDHGATIKPPGRGGTYGVTVGR